MLAKADVAKIYETVLSTPGMGDEVKITLKASRKNILLLSKIIERGLSENPDEGKGGNILDVVSKESVQELAAIPVDLLQKSGLTEMNQRLQAL